MKSLSSCDFQSSPINGLMSLADASALITGGSPLAISGTANALDALPHGNWIGGSTPYFMTSEGGKIVGDDQVFVTDLSAMGTVQIAHYDAHELHLISENGPENGFSLTIIPAMSSCHERFALESGTYPQAFLKPTVGWIAGYNLADSSATAWVYDGTRGEKYANRAVCAHISLPDDQLASIEIANLFEANDGDTLRFEHASSQPDRCLVNGVASDFADYVERQGYQDGRLPLVGDYAGARINVSIKSVDASEGVSLYAPVFPDVDYHFARPIDDYAASFRKLLSERNTDGTLWSCNCILNFLFGSLEGKSIGALAGPVTFGEIAYQLLNQTMVIVRRV